MLVGVLGVLRSRLGMGIALGLFVLVYLAVTLTPLRAAAPDRLLSLLRLGLPFAIGTGFYVWRARLVLHPGLLLGLAGLTLLAWNSVLYPALFVLSLCLYQRPRRLTQRGDSQVDRDSDSLPARQRRQGWQERSRSRGGR